LNKAWVAKDAQWVAHVDVEAGLASTLGRYMITHRDELKLDGIEEVKAELGIDPLSDIKSLTIYGSASDGSDGIAVIHTTAAVEGMIAKMREKEKSLTTVSVNGMTLYTWDDHGMTRFAQVRRASVASDRIVIVGADKDRLLSGISVLEGKSADLTAGADGSVATTPKAGSFLFAAMNKLPDSEAAPLKQAKSIVMDLGEADREIFADLSLETRTAKDATNLVAVMQGGLALARMAASGDPEHPELREISALADGITISANESRISAKFRYSAEKITSCLQGLSALRNSLERGDGEGASQTTKTRKEDARSKD
jgi:hypothetical protein